MLKTLLKIFFLMQLPLNLYGCTAKGWYEGARHEQRLNCTKEHNKSEYEACMERTKIEYEQYEQSRKESTGSP